MGRIYNAGRVVVDLGNIKYIDTKDGKYDDCYLRIHLLKGSEYVYNPETEEIELIEPKIEIYMSQSEAGWLIEEISEEWEKYLENKDVSCDADD